MLLHGQCVSSDRRHCLGWRSCCARLKLFCARDTVAAPCSRAHGLGGKNPCSAGKSCCVRRLYRKRELPQRQEALLWMVGDVVAGGKRRCCERQERAAAL